MSFWRWQEEEPGVSACGRLSNDGWAATACEDELKYICQRGTCTQLSWLSLKFCCDFITIFIIDAVQQNPKAFTVLYYSGHFDLAFEIVCFLLFSEINECASNPCVNGSCTDALNLFVCSCNDGFEGVHCDAIITTTTTSSTTTTPQAAHSQSDIVSRVTTEFISALELDFTLDVISLTSQSVEVETSSDEPHLDSNFTREEEPAEVTEAAQTESSRVHSQCWLTSISCNTNHVFSVHSTSIL